MVVQFNIPQQQKAPLTPGASTPQASAAMKIDNMNKEQAAVNKIGGKKYKNFNKGGGTIAIPPTSTSSYNVNGIVKEVVTNDVKAQANGEYDKGAFSKGGSRRYRNRKSKKTKRRSKKRSRHNRTRRNYS